MPQPTTNAVHFTPPPRAVVENPDSFTHFICPETEKGELTPVTHHMRDIGDNSTCRYCGKTALQIRSEVGL